jgi:hypothetical protein
MVDVVVRFNSKKIVADVKNVVDSEKKSVVDDLFQTVKRRSPVQTGKFRRSWSKSVSTSRITIKNPQPYGGELEKGKSRQAPMGVVQPSVNEVIARQQNRRRTK